MKKITSLMVLLLIANLLMAQSDLTPEQVTLQTAIQNELACYCGCGMTIQGCLGGMTCSESKAVSKQVVSLLQSGKNKPEIIQAMVAQYGERILAAPTKEGFNLTAWILPFVALVVGGLIVAKVISSWKQQTQPQASPSSPVAQKEEKSSDPYQERFERELKEFDK